jgi:hypothetical protein
VALLRLLDDDLGHGASALWKGAIYAGIAGIAGPALWWLPAAGLKGSLLDGTASQKLARLGAAIAFVAVGIAVVYHWALRIHLCADGLTGFGPGRIYQAHAPGALDGRAERAANGRETRASHHGVRSERRRDVATTAPAGGHTFGKA